TVSAFAHFDRAGSDRRRAPPLLRRNDARHGYPGSVARRLPPSLWHGYARGKCSVALSGGSADAVGGGVGPAARPRPCGNGPGPCGDGHSCPSSGAPPRLRSRNHPLLLRRRRPERDLEPGACEAEATAAAAELQLHRQHRRVLRLARQEIQRAESAGGSADRQAWIPPRTACQAPQIWRGDSLSPRRRWGRCEDYCTISSLRFEEAGGEVCAVGAGVGTIDRLRIQEKWDERN